MLEIVIFNTDSNEDVLKKIFQKKNDVFVPIAGEYSIFEDRIGIAGGAVWVSDLAKHALSLLTRNNIVFSASHEKFVNGKAAQDAFEKSKATLQSA